MRLNLDDVELNGASSNVINLIIDEPPDVFVGAFEVLLPIV